MNIKPQDRVTIPAPTPSDEGLLTCDGWPDISIANFRDVMRLDGTINTARASAALMHASWRVQDELRAWLSEQSPDRFVVLTRTDPRMNDIPRRVGMYIQAVYCYAAAAIYKRMHAFDATHQGQQHADDLSPLVQDLPAQGLAHIRAIMGRPAGDAELL